MITVERVSASNEDFKRLVKLLDAELAIRDGDDHDFYHQFNGINHLKNIIVAYHKNVPVGCGAINHFDTEHMELKRMFTHADSRGKGIASRILKELESWTAELGYAYCLLETGVNQPEAISLYKKKGYERIPNYGQYEDVLTSFCFRKRVTLQ